MSFPTRPLHQLKSHTGPVNTLTFSSGLGQYVLSGSSDRSIHLSNPLTSTLIQTYSAHGHPVLSLAVSADNSRFASSGGDRAVFIWDVARGITTRRFTGHGSGAINAVAWGGEGDSVVVSGGFDKTVRVWDHKALGSNNRPIMVLEEARDSVTCVLASGHEILAGCVDGRVRGYDLRMGMVGTDVIGQPVTSLSMTRDGAAVLVSSLDSTVRLLDRGSGGLLKSYRGHVNGEFRVKSQLAGRERWVVSGSEEKGEVVVWDLLEGEVVGRLGGQHGGRGVLSLAVNDVKDGLWVSGGLDGSVQVWAKE